MLSLLWQTNRYLQTKAGFSNGQKFMPGVIKYLSLNPTAIRLGSGTIPKDLRDRSSILTAFTPGATFSHLVNSYGGFTKGLRFTVLLYSTET